MAKNGIRFPEIVDLVTSKDKDCVLYIIQVDRVGDNDLPALQSKINHYLSFALDGQLLSDYPSMSGKHVIIRIQLSCEPTPVQQDFYIAVTQVCASKGIGFEVELPEYLRELEKRYPTQPRSNRPWWQFW